jgi:hypothetical protein
MSTITSNATESIRDLLHARPFCPCRTVRVTGRFPRNPLVLPPSNRFLLLFQLPHIFIVILFPQATFLPIAFTAPCSLPARLGLFCLTITLLSVCVLTTNPADGDECLGSSLI